MCVMHSRDTRVSHNVRYLLWKRGIERRSWGQWLVKHCGISAGLGLDLLHGRVADQEIDTAYLEQLCRAFGFEEEEQALRYGDLIAERVDVLQENLRFLFGGLGHGGKKSVAKALQVDPTTISRWLNGAFEPTRSGLEALGRYFGLPRGLDLRRDPVFLSVLPVATVEQKRWTVERIEAMETDEFRELYPALRRILGPAVGEP